MRNEIKEEIQAIAASVADIGNANCYRVPDNYFEDLADEVVSRIQLPFTQSPFTAPTPAYFEGLAGSILNKIKTNGIIVEEDSEVKKELMELSPLLAGMQKTKVYTVPADYFTNFKVEKPAAAERGKLLTMRQPVRWVRYAAAAAVAGVIAVSSIFLFNNEGDHGVLHNTPSLASVSDDAIANYLKNAPADMDILPIGYDESKVNAGSLTEQLLHDLSDTEIQEYLKENQQTGEKDIKGI